MAEDRPTLPDGDPPSGPATPAGQSTPTRPLLRRQTSLPDPADLNEDRTIMRPRKTSDGDADATHYAPPAPPVADATHYAPGPGHRDADATHYAPPAADPDATHYAPEAPPPTDPDATVYSGPAFEGTRYAPRDDDSASATTNPGSWVSDASWTKQTQTPTSIPPIPRRPEVTQASQVPTFPRSSYSIPEDRFVAPPPQRQRRKVEIPLRRMIGWALAVALLAVSAGVVYVTFFRKVEVDEATKVPVSSTASIQVRRGDEAVRNYLQALAKGDAEAALAMGPKGGQGSAALLTKAALQQTVKAAPITDINVPTTDQNATVIPATYKLGGTEVKTQFQVRKLDSGSWEMAKTTVTFRVQGTNSTNVPLLINGVPVEWDGLLELLPGRYNLSSGLPFVGYNAEDAITVLHLEYNDITPHPVNPSLTEAGLTAFRTAAESSLKACLAKQELAPADCPQSVSPARPVQPQTVRWALIGNPVPAAKVGLVASDQSKAETTMSLNLQLSLTYTDQGRLNNTPLTQRARATAVMTVKSADLVKVTWKPLG